MTSLQKSKNKKKQSTQASRADKHRLYENSVQNVEAEIDFVDSTFRALRKRKAQTLREDFCGTAKTACEWVQRRNNNHAIAVDLDPVVLEWGRVNTLGKLTGSQQKRIRQVNADVVEIRDIPVDIVLAMNFSYWVFKDRPSMIKYFRRVHASLTTDGIFFLDAFGGYEAIKLLNEHTDYGRFTYIWDQAEYNPINGHCTYKIHYKFKDGSRLKDAFVYHWRVWTLPELTEMLTEAGFKATVYWEGTDEHGEDNGVYEPMTRGTADAGWIVYIVAEK